jgi:glucose-6-phosphate 1-dehydrogenase
MRYEQQPGFGSAGFQGRCGSYQRLLLDAMNGDASLFARSDEVEVAWTIIDPIIAAWQASDSPKVEAYPRGDWGPTASNTWMQQQGREWFDVCPVLHSP